MPLPPRTGSPHAHPLRPAPRVRLLAEDGRDALLRPVDAVLTQLPRVGLDEALAGRFRHGQTVTLEGVPAGVSRVYGPSGRFLGLAEEGGEGRLVPKRLLAEVAKDPPTG